MDNQSTIDWLLKGDVSIQYQVWRDLLGEDRKDLQRRIKTEGWGIKFLSKQKANGQWGKSFYQPKWTSTHYTLLDLRYLNLPADDERIEKTLTEILKNNQADDGGIRLGPTTAKLSDVCVNGMFLNYASYFNLDPKKLHPLVDCILKEKMPDGGFNCKTIRTGAHHSSLHSTLSVLEGLTEFQLTGSVYKKSEISKAKRSSIEFILQHQLFISDRTGKIINKNFLKLTYPCRWKYDILRALDFFQYDKLKWDNRLTAALAILQSKKNKDGTWNSSSPHPGLVHFHMEKAGKPGRWNTLRMLRVLKHFKLEL